MIPDETEAILAAYHRWYYATNVWDQTTFLGVLCMKAVTDLWSYQEIISQLAPSIIVEFGTYIGGSAPGPLFAILDSDHRKSHVVAELKSLRFVTSRGDYVVVEDTNMNGHPIITDFGDGPMEAVAAYESEFPYDYRHDKGRETKFGLTFAPRGYLIRQ